MGSTTRFELARLHAWALLRSGAGTPLAAGIAGAAAWAVGAPMPVAAVAACAGAAIGRWLPDVVSGPDRRSRAAYHAVFPLFLIAAFALTAESWGPSWLAAAVALGVSWGLALWARRRLFPDVFLEEEAGRRRELDELAV
jgi:hypothetical protein